MRPGRSKKCENGGPPAAESVFFNRPDPRGRYSPPKGGEGGLISRGSRRAHGVWFTKGSALIPPKGMVRNGLALQCKSKLAGEILQLPLEYTRGTRPVGHRDSVKTRVQGREQVVSFGERAQVYVLRIPTPWQMECSEVAGVASAGAASRRGRCPLTAAPPPRALPA